MKRKILYFINPISGPNRKKPLEYLIKEKTQEQKIDYEILPAEKNGAYPFLKDKIKKEKFTDVVICGGDGTVNQVASALLGIDINIGIIPAGSGNGLAFTAKIPKQPSRALDLIFSATAQYIDAFYINNYFSCMLCGIGFDAQVAHDFALDKNRGLTTYVKQSVKNFFKASPYIFDITVNGNTFSTEAFFISVANSNQFGNNFTIAPKASLNDGLLDIIIVKKMSKVKLLWAVLQQIKFGEVKQNGEKNFNESEVLYFQTDKLVIHNPLLAPLHVDGDPAITDKKLSVKILPLAFKLLQPS
ncbi:MAG: YegS/Rv2252/BmrU family lipid kinase [Ginsengibacter sp.]